VVGDNSIEITAAATIAMASLNGGFMEVSFLLIFANPDGEPRERFVGRLVSSSMRLWGGQ
jgi:hypothetical protein